MDAQRTLEGGIKDSPSSASALLASAIELNPQCAPDLLTSAITASEASDSMVAELVSSAVRAAPNQAVAIAESAISVSPSASDEVAEVVQSVLGDCDSIAEDVAISINRNRSRMLVILEDSLKSHENCACEIVKAVVRTAGNNKKAITEIVEMAVKAAPVRAAEISECAVAVAPNAIAAIQSGLDRAVADTKRGPGALPAQAEVDEPANGDSSTPSEMGEVDRIVSDEPSQRSYGKNGVGYGKNSYGKNGSGSEEKTTEEPSEDRWDWIPWGGAGNLGASVYLIAPAGGVVPPGELVPLSPSDPKPDDKKDDKNY